MIVIKPQSLGVLFRPMEYRKRFGLCVSGFLHVPFAQQERPSLWAEQSMWTFLTKEMEVPVIDEGIAKLTSEFLVHGYAYPTPDRRDAVAVRARLGTTEKTVLAFGDRYWDGSAPSRPAPFERMPLSWANAYGGPDFPANPIGKGRQVVDGLRWLPNLELPGSRIRSADQPVLPGGFGSLDVTHPQRAALRGTYDQKWLEEHSGGFAPDLAWKYFNMALRDQWVEPGLQGDEPYALENLHPSRPLIEGRLPGMKVRMFANQAIGSGADKRHKMREVAMRLSTVWFFPHAERMVLVFHGTTACAQDDASDIEHLIAAVETLSPADRREDAHYLEVLAKRTAPGPAAALHALNDADLVSPSIDTFDPESAAAQAAMKPEGLQAEAQYTRAQIDVELARDQVRARGLDPDALGVVMPPREKAPTPAEMPAYLEKLRKQVEDEPWLQLEAVVTQVEKVIEFAQKHKVDPATLVHRGPPPQRAPAQLALAENEMKKSGKPADLAGLESRLVMGDLAAQRDYQQGAHMQAPALALKGEAAAAARAEVEWLLERGIRSVPGIDLTGADLSNMDLRHLDFTGAWLESVDFSGSNLSHSIFRNAVLAHCRMRGTLAIRCDFSGANLGAADLEAAVFDQADLSGAILMRTRLTHTELRGAKLASANLLESLWNRVDCTEASAPAVFFNKLGLADCIFIGAQLQTAQFVECQLPRADFRSAHLDSTSFIGCQLEAALFGGAQMPGAVFVSASQLTRCDFTDADLQGANLGACDASGARFLRARLDGANLGQATLRGSDLRMASAKGAILRKAVLAQSLLAGVDFKDAILQGADLRGADLHSAHLFGADLSRVQLDADSRLDGAVFERARIFPRHRPATAAGEG